MLLAADTEILGLKHAFCSRLNICNPEVKRRELIN